MCASKPTPVAAVLTVDTFCELVPTVRMTDNDTQAIGDAIFIVGTGRLAVAFRRLRKHRKNRPKLQMDLFDLDGHDPFKACLRVMEAGVSKTITNDNMNTQCEQEELIIHIDWSGPYTESQISFYAGRLFGYSNSDDETWCRHIRLAERLLI